MRAIFSSLPQTSVLFEVYEGERPLVRDNNLLGSYVIDNIPSAPRGAVKFDTTFSIDEDGILTVTSRERKTGVSQRITIGSDQHRLSRLEVQAMLREAELYRAQVSTQAWPAATWRPGEAVASHPRLLSFQDERQRRRLESRRKLENLAYTLKQVLGDGEGQELALVKVGPLTGPGLELEAGLEDAEVVATAGAGRLSVEERAAAERAYREVLEWLEGEQSEQTQIDDTEYETRYLRLKTVWRAFKSGSLPPQLSRLPLVAQLPISSRRVYSHGVFSYSDTTEEFVHRQS